MKLLEVLAAFAPTSSTIAVQESLPGTDYTDPDIDLTAVQGGAQFFRRLTQSKSDLAPITHERMQEIALTLYDRNPLAKRCLELVKDFVVGEGIVPSAKVEGVQAVIGRFWNDGQNAMAARCHTFALELGLWGEQAFAAFVHERSGHVRLVSIDPRSIKAVVPDPENPDLPLALALAAEQGTEARYLKIIREDDDGMLVGAQPDETVRVGDGQHPYYSPPSLMPGTRLVGAFFWAVNKTQGATRGRSDLLPVADFLDLYDRLIFDEAERMSFLRAFVYDVTITGADEAALTKRAATAAPPKPGSVYYHNESEELKAVTPDLKAQDGATTADLILSLIATGVGLPKTWLNGIMDVNRASAVSMDEPSLKRLRARQQVVMAAVERMVRFALDQASMAGALPKAGDEGHSFSVDAPEMSQRDAERASRALFSTIQALGMADAAGWIDSETARQAVVMMLTQLGVNVDLAELKERLDAERAAESDDDEYEIPPYFGVGSQAGKDEITKAIGGDSGGDTAGRAPMVADPKTGADILAKVSDALVTLGNAGVIDGQFAQEVVARLFAMFGVTVDVEAMRARLEEEDAEEEMAAGDGETDPLADLDLEDELVVEALREAFDEAKVKRGPGGKFAEMPDVTDEYSPASKELRAQIEKILGEKKGKPKGAGKAKKPKAAGGKGKTQKAKPLTKAALTQSLRQLKQGNSVTVTLANGSVITGKVDRAAGGVAIVQTAKGAVILHNGLRNVAKIEG